MEQFTPLPRSFYDRDTRTVARELIGKRLVHLVDGVPLSGIITETEAYIGRMDKACHAYGYKKTARTATLFARPGTAYVYLIYGMYYCLNVVTEPEGEPCAVLIRGVRAEGHADDISRRRFHCTVAQQTAYQRKNFLNGPGKVCKGFSIDKHCNQMDMTASGLLIADGVMFPNVKSGTRIGIDYAEEAAAFPWRFYV